MFVCLLVGWCVCQCVCSLVHIRSPAAIIGRRRAGVRVRVLRAWLRLRPSSEHLNIALLLKQKEQQRVAVVDPEMGILFLFARYRWWWPTQPRFWVGHLSADAVAPPMSWLHFFKNSLFFRYNLQCCTVIISLSQTVYEYACSIRVLLNLISILISKKYWIRLMHYVNS